MSNKLLIENIKIYTQEAVYEKGYLKIEGEVISEFGDMNELTKKEGYHAFSIPTGCMMIPGMIDLHIHGVNGADTMDATVDAIDTMTETLPAEGTTSFLATTITEKKESIERALKNVSHYMRHHNQAGRAEVLGVHLEGPFINREKAGAQPVNDIVKPDIELFKSWQILADNQIKLVTLAPEEDERYALIQYLKETGVIASAGHTNATYKQMLKAIDSGLGHVTHLYNQMSGLHHREPGVVGAAFLREELMVELIADGIHVTADIVDLTFQQLSENRLILITDSMRAKCLENGEYELGGQKVIVKDGKALLDEHTLAGSVLKMIDAFKNLQQYSHCSVQQAIKVTAVNPAKQLGIFDQKGSIALGKDADIVILTQEFEVFLTLCKGKIAYRKELNS